MIVECLVVLEITCHFNAEDAAREEFMGGNTSKEKEKERRRCRHSDYSSGDSRWFS
jgi:hypothetical protein